MDLKQQILDSLTQDDIIDIMGKFNVPHKFSSQGNVIFQTACHGGSSFKLYYYEQDADGEESKHFHCYTHCGGMSLFTTFMSIMNKDFKGVINYLSDYKGLSTVYKKPKGFDINVSNDDWEFMDKYDALSKHKKEVEIKKLPRLNESILNMFDNIYPSDWEEEGISTKAMRKFDIQFYVTGWKAVIPHRDLLGNLIGIRGRSYSEFDLDKGRKYMPIYLENKGYRHPLQYNLYGAYENEDAIKKTRKVMLFEGEKSVMLSETFYPNNNFSVGLCGTNLSNWQRDIILDYLNVNEVFIALDKQYKTKLETEEDEVEYERYIKKVTKIADKFVNYVDVYIIYDDNDLLDYKDAPIDQGQEVFEKLMREKVRYYKEEE